MLNNYEKIMQIANSVGLNEAAARVASVTEQIKNRDKLHIAFVGGPNSGKSTIINKIAGKEIREPSNISIEDERPLRITFERSESDVRFECVDVYDRDWNEENAAIFEFKTTDLICNNKLTELADEIDVVFYLISAMSPFTADDVAVIKGLAKYKIIPVLTKIDAVDEESKERVIKYVNSTGVNYGLAEPIIIDKENMENISKIIRDVLPLYTEQVENREKYCSCLWSELEALVKETINRKIADLDKSHYADVDHKQNRNHSRALETRRGILELGAARSKRYADGHELVNKLEKNLIKSGSENSYSDAWKANLGKKIIVPLILAEFEEENTKLKKNLFADCCSINPSDEETRKLKQKIDEVTKNAAQIFEITDKEIVLRDGKASINYKTVGVTAAVVAGAIIIPMPTIATWILSMGAIAVGTGSVIIEKNRAEEEKWNINIKEYSKLVASGFYESMRIYNNEVYNKLAEFMFDGVMSEGNAQAEQKSNDIVAEKEKYTKMLEELA